MNSKEIKEKVLKALDEPYTRLNEPNNLRTKVNQWRQNNP